MMRAVAVIASLVLLAGCSWFGDKDNAEPPAKLESFDRQLELRDVWRRDTGSGTKEQFVTLVPAVDGERVFAADRNGAVYAFTLETGKEIWHQKTRAAISAGPGVGEGLVLLGTSDAGIIALDADSGEMRWHASVSSEVLAVPQVSNGVVVAQTADGQLTGLDARSGERLWSEGRTVPVLTLRGTSTPLVEGGIVIAGFANGKMSALDISSGRRIWEAAVAVPSGRSELQRIVDIDASPVIRSGVLYVGSFQGQLAAIDLVNGRSLWDREMSVYAGLAVDTQHVYVTDEASEVWALDRSSGASLWKQTALRRRAVTGPAVVGGYVAVGDYEGYLHILSRHDGSIVGRTRVDSDGILVAPLALGDRLLVQGAGGKLALYTLQSGRD
ncbi:MAG: outer membrane protein assembly factor BamB [Thiogranum sp.]|nr:outer membrane protein assembly factor BamB [Thiogranum sp.]